MIESMMQSLSVLERQYAAQRWWDIFGARTKKHRLLLQLQRAALMFKRSPSEYVLDWMRILVRLEMQFYRRRPFWSRWFGLKSEYGRLWYWVRGWRRRFQSQHRRLLYAGSRGKTAGYLNVLVVPRQKKCDPTVLPLLVGAGHAERTLRERAAWVHVVCPQSATLAVASDAETQQDVQRFSSAFQHERLCEVAQGHLRVFLEGFLARYDASTLMDYLEEGMARYGAEHFFYNGLMQLWVGALKRAVDSPRDLVWDFLRDKFLSLIKAAWATTDWMVDLAQVRRLLSQPYVPYLFSQSSRQQDREWAAQVRSAVYVFCVQYCESLPLHCAGDFYRLVKQLPLVSVIGGDGVGFDEAMRIIRERFVSWLHGLGLSADFEEGRRFFDETKALKEDLDWNTQHESALLDHADVRQALNTCAERCLQHQLIHEKYYEVARWVKKGRGRFRVAPGCGIDPRPTVVAYVQSNARYLMTVENYLAVFQLINCVFHKKWGDAFFALSSMCWCDELVGCYLVRLMLDSDPKQFIACLNNPSLKLVINGENYLSKHHVTRILMQFFQQGEFDLMHCAALTTVIAPVMLKHCVTLESSALAPVVNYDVRSGAAILMFGSLAERRVWHMRALAPLSVIYMNVDSVRTWGQAYIAFHQQRERHAVEEIDTLTSAGREHTSEQYWVTLAWQQARNLHPVVGYAIAKRYTNDVDAASLRLFWVMHGHFQALCSALKSVLASDVDVLWSQLHSVAWASGVSDFDDTLWSGLLSALNQACTVLSLEGGCDARLIWAYEVFEFFSSYLRGRDRDPEVRTLEGKLLQTMKNQFRFFVSTVLNADDFESAALMKFAQRFSSWSLNRRKALLGSMAVYGDKNKPLVDVSESMASVRPDLAVSLAKAHFLLQLYESGQYRQAAVELLLLMSEPLEPSALQELSAFVCGGLQAAWDKTMSAIQCATDFLEWMSALHDSGFYAALEKKMRPACSLVACFQAHQRGVRLYQEMHDFLLQVKTVALTDLSLETVLSVATEELRFSPVLFDALMTVWRSVALPEELSPLFLQCLSKMKVAPKVVDLQKESVALSEALFRVQRQHVLPPAEVARFFGYLLVELERVAKKALCIPLGGEVPDWAYDLLRSLGDACDEGGGVWQWTAYSGHAQCDQLLQPLLAKRSTMQRRALQHIVIFWAQVRQAVSMGQDDGCADARAYYRAFWKVGGLAVAYHCLTVKGVAHPMDLRPYFRSLFACDTKAQRWLGVQLSVCRESRVCRIQEEVMIHQQFYWQCFQGMDALCDATVRLWVHLSHWWGSGVLVSTLLMSHVRKVSSASDRPEFVSRLYAVLKRRCIPAFLAEIFRSAREEVVPSRLQDLGQRRWGSGVFNQEKRGSARPPLKQTQQAALQCDGVAPVAAHSPGVVVRYG